MFLLFLFVACTRETPAPPPQADTTPDPAPAAAPSSPRYADAMTWFRSTPGFHFAVEEGGVRATGEMVRPTVGAERVRLTVEGTEWTAEASPKGVVWRRGGKEVPAPEWGNRMYQRVTIAFDPEKREGEAQLVEPGHYRFTDANSGAVHDVWVNASGRIDRMTIGSSFALTLTDQK